MADKFRLVQCEEGKCPFWCIGELPKCTEPDSTIQKLNGSSCQDAQLQQTLKDVVDMLEKKAKAYSESPAAWSVAYRKAAEELEREIKNVAIR